MGSMVKKGLELANETVPNHVWVSKPYREFIAERLNIRKQWQWHILEYLLFYPHIDRRIYPEDQVNEDGDQHQAMADEPVIVSEEYIRSITAIKKGPRKNSVMALLDEFSADTGIIFDIHPHRLYNPRARSVSVQYPAGILDATEEEISTMWRDKKDILLFSTGVKYTDRLHAEFRRRYLNYILQCRLKNADHPAYELATYMHSRRINHFLNDQVIKTEEIAKEAINKIDFEPRRRYALRVYNMIRQCAYMHYRDTEKTCRIHATNYSILQLPREIRRAVFTGLYSLDLRSSQLAIIADLWPVKSAREFLDTGNSIWAELLSFTGLDGSFKPEVKTFLYSLIFGMGKRNLRAKAAEQFGNDVILKHPIIRNILAQRKQKLDEIVCNGGGFDVWGHFHCMNFCATKGSSTRYAKKILARIVQSYEMEIMLAGFAEIKKRDKDLALVAWLHDGLYVAATNHKSHIKRYLEDVNRAVKKKASEMGIKTELEIDLVTQN